MAVDSKSSPKASNEHVNGKARANPSTGRGRSGKKRKGFVSWAVNAIARLATWFAIFTILFRCPPTLDACDETSPFICKYYFQAKNIVSPHVQPYYDQYAAPYVDIAQPYYDTLNTKVLVPTRSYAVQYGAPWVNKARDYSIEKWEEIGQPRVQELRDLAQSRYDQSVAPYLAQAGDALGPYYNIAKSNSLELFHDFLLPSYVVVQPYAAQAYEIASDFTTSTALPTARWAWNKTNAFLDTAVWPQLRIVYLENVEPQLVRIGERLGRYKTKVRSKSSTVVHDGDKVSTESSFSKPTPQPTGTSASGDAYSTLDAGSQEDTEFVASPVEAPPPTENETEKRQKARKMVAEDLELWQTKFAARADEGANDMEERIDEIAKSMVENIAHTTGKALVEKLESTVESEMGTLKQRISEAVEKAAESTDAAEEDAIQAVRSAGVAIKEKAQAVRKWRQTYDTELQNTVVNAADIHFQILDEIRGLALQQIGMKWAWADGVTYKDWEKYHELKNTLREWTDQLKQLIVSHPSLLQAQDASAEVEDESMEIASLAAKELVRLKEVAHWKIVAKDATDNFESEAMELAAEAAEQAAKAAAEASQKAAKEAAEASQKAAEAEQTIAAQAENAASIVIDEASESISVAGDNADDAISSGSSVVGVVEESVSEAIDQVESSVPEVTSAVSDVAEDQSTAASQFVSSILSEGTETASEVSADVHQTADSASSVASSGITQVVKETSSATDEASSAAGEVFSEASEAASSESSDVSSVLSETFSSASEYGESEQETASSLASEVSEVLVGKIEPIVGNVSEGEAEEEEEIVEADEETATEEGGFTVSDATESVKPAMFGAAAQSVSDRKPILEDYEDTDDVSGIGSSAEAAYSNAVSAAAERYSSAVSVISAQIYGTPKPVHQELFSSISTAYDNAIAAASSRFSEVVAAASSGVKGTPTPAPTPTSFVDWSKVESIAAQRLSEGRLWAELQYQSAVIALGLATPTPTSVTERYLDEAKKNYYAGIGLAQERYSSFIAAASSAMSSLTATPTPTNFVGSASSWASAAKESAASAVHAAEDAAGSAYSAATGNVASAINAVDEGIVSVIDAASEQVYLTGSAIAERWDSVISDLSGRIYGEQKQIGWYDHLFKDAGSAANVVTDAAEDAAATASAEVAKQYSAVNELVSELVSGKEASFTESVLSRLNAVYATAAASVGNYANEATQAAASVGDRVSSAVSHATEIVKETMQHAKDEL